MQSHNRWFLSLSIIALVVMLSAAIIVTNRAPDNGIYLQAVSDGAGGTIIAWQKQGIYLQRLSATGQPLWQEGGVKVSEVSYASNYPLTWRTTFTLVLDGTGGAIITWDDKSQRPSDHNDPTYFDPIPFYSQRISPNGDFLWEETFIGFGGTFPYGDSYPVVVSDGTGGAIFAWNNYKTYFKALHDDFFCIQKIARDGTRLWGEEGKTLVNSSPYRTLTEAEKSAGIKGTIGRSLPTYTGTHDIASNGDGGVFVIWEEEGNQGERTVYAQRLDGNGNPVWNDSVMLWGAPYLGGSLHSDGSGGAILAGPSYWQHIGGNGELLERTDYFPDSVSDGLDGHINVRVENRPLHIAATAIPPYYNQNIVYVQRFDDQKKPVWPEKPVFATPDGSLLAPLDYIADGRGGIILIWQLQKRNVAYGGTFAQKIDAEGTIKWDEEGLAVFNASDSYQDTATVLSDGSGGALIIAIAGNKVRGGNMVYAQHLTADGTRLWSDGIRIDR